MFAFLATAALCAGSDTPPNILFIFSDDHATAAISAYGSPGHAGPLNQTPHIDRLGAEGIVFDRALCTNAICAPSRAVVLTGKHSHKNGVATNADFFDGAQTTFPKLLQEAGYSTALIGKWHLKTDPTGFDHWEVLPGQGQYYNPNFETAEGKTRREGYVTSLITDMSIEWLETQRDPEKPFLLLCQHKAPHRTWMPGPKQLGQKGSSRAVPRATTLFNSYGGRSQASLLQEMTIGRHLFDHYDLKLPILAGKQLTGPDQWADTLLERMNPEQRKLWTETFAKRNESYLQNPPVGKELVHWKYQRYLENYLASVEGVDDSVGQLLEYLDESGLAENTIVVYSSDQGFFLGEHGWYDKRFMYEPALRMPLLVRWPNVIPAGTRDAHLVQNIDFAPTLLEAAGVPVPAEMQGESLLPLARDEAVEDWRKAAYYEYSEVGIHAVEPHYGVTTERYKLIHFHRLGEWEFYDLVTDPDEMKNLIEDPSQAQNIAALRTELTRLRQENGAAPEPERPPNIVIMFTDDQGYGDVGVYDETGALGFETPNMDRLAAEGIRFTNFYVSQPVCSASRVSLLTGCYANRVGIGGALGPGAMKGLNSEETTLAEICKSRGYATAIFGKWHLGHRPPFLPTRHGFDEFLGTPYSNDMWPLHPEYVDLPPDAAGRKRGFPDLPFFENERIVKPKITGEDQAEFTNLFTERAVEFIHSNAEKPFFLHVPHPMPHVPLFTSRNFRDVSEQGAYGDVISEIDWSLGQILEALELEGLENDTLVIFTSDNGPWLSYGNHAGSSGPLREGKGTTYEGGVRVPFIVRWPGHFPAGAVCDEPAMTIDILPTVAGLIGAPLPEKKIDGLDIVPLLQGEEDAKSPHEALFFYYDKNSLQAVRSDRWKLVFPHVVRTLTGEPGMDGSPAGYSWPTCGLELYDLVADRSETTNLVDEHPEVVARLQALAETMRDDLGDGLQKRQGNGVRPAGVYEEPEAEKD